jgi:peptide/nickel transport system ATP-binding protein
VPGQAVLQVDDLHVSYQTRRGPLQVLRGVNLDIGPGEVVGLVGESGSGKSTLAYACVRYLSGNATIPGGDILFQGESLFALSEERLRALRGKKIGMVYQDPNTSLNPTLRLGEQVAEVLRHHERLGPDAARQRTRELLESVRLADPDFIMTKFPHEVSGGEKQRVLIAMALACRPSLLVLDEPTTALDATTSVGILDLIRTLQQETGVAVLYITHELGVIARIAQRISVIYAGSIVEEGASHEVLEAPRHPYTRALLASIPNPYKEEAGRRLVTFTGASPNLLDPPEGCIFQDRCPFVRDECRHGVVELAGDGQLAACVRLPEIQGVPLPSTDPHLIDQEAAADRQELLAVEDLRVIYGRPSPLEKLLPGRRRRVHAVSGVDFTIRQGETFGLVGESGCGKSSLARALVGLEEATGSVRLNGRRIELPARLDGKYRKSVQIVFQHPDHSLNPRQTVGAIISRPLRLYGSDGVELKKRVLELLEQVRLPGSYATRYPHQLSGGEKQRVAIARAFATRPRLVICDEITSGLDVSVQASIVNLLADLQDRYGTAYIFISHDLNLVRQIADRVAVMYLGRFVEAGHAEELFNPPYHPYTEALLSAVPIPDARLRGRAIRLHGALPSPKDPPQGCPFHTRCPHKLGAICEREPPPRQEFGGGHWLSCHIPSADLRGFPPIWTPVEERAPASADGIGAGGSQVTGPGGGRGLGASDSDGTGANGFEDIGNTPTREPR